MKYSTAEFSTAEISTNSC